MSKTYIPKDLDDCFIELKKILYPKCIEDIKNSRKGDIPSFHFGLGRYLRNKWKLWGESRLVDWFNTQGIKHPDDMSGIILDSFWRNINSKPIELEEQIKFYQEYWKKQKDDKE